MPDLVRDRIHTYAEVPEVDVTAAGEAVVARGRRALRRRRVVTAGALAVVVLLSGVAVAEALRSSGPSTITTVDDPPSPSPSAPAAGDRPYRSLGLSAEAERRLSTNNVEAVERCLQARGIDAAARWDEDGTATWSFVGVEAASAEVREAMGTCSEAAGEVEVAERARLLEEAGNPVVTFTMDECPALADVLARGTFPARFNTDDVVGRGGGIPTRLCYGEVRASGDEVGMITIAEGSPTAEMESPRSIGSYEVATTDDGIVAVYRSDQMLPHYIEAIGVTAGEFETLISSL